MAVTSVDGVNDPDAEGIMLVRDVMTTNVVSVPSTEPLAEARRKMEAHRIRHLPVVDKGKLVGLVSKDSLDRAGPSQLTTFSIHEITYLLSRLTVAEVMKREIVAVPPTATVEEAVALARRRKVDSLLVLERDRLVGIATANDFFDKVANPILGIDKPGIRLGIRGCCHRADDLRKLMDIIGRFEADIISLCMVVRPESGGESLIIHLDSPDITTVVEALLAGGFDVHERAR